jgi:DNA-binding HxlR family transcriptional regulator
MALFDLLGRRWAMGILWTICETGPVRFRELQERCESLSPTVLNVRLKELGAAGFVERTPEGYVATRMGRDLYEQLVPLGITARRWAKELERERRE